MKYLSYLVAILILLVDQLTKSNAINAVSNQGIALGLLSSSMVLSAGLDLVVLITLSVINVFLVKGKQIKLLTWMVVIISLSNLIDRLRIGYVVDYFHFGSIAFNLADIGICVLVLLILWQLYIKNDSRSTHRKSRH